MNAMNIFYLSFLIVFCERALARVNLELEAGAEDVVDLDTRVREIRGYGSVGGPLAASGLPPSISPNAGAPAKDIIVRNPCGDSGECGYDMKPQQRLTDLQYSVNQLLGLSVCTTIEDCQRQCDKNNGCNYITLAGQTSPFVAHFYKISDSAVMNAGYSATDVYDSLAKTCGKGRMKRRNKRGAMGPNPGPVLPPSAFPNSPPKQGPEMPPVSGPKSAEMPGSRPFHPPQPTHPPPHTPPPSPIPHPTVPPTTPPSPHMEHNATGTPIPPRNNSQEKHWNSTARTGTYYKKYSEHYDRKYKTEEEEQKRQQQFSENLEWMYQANTGDITNKKGDDAKCGLNPFSDENRKTFSTNFGGAKVDPKKDVAPSLAVAPSELSGLKLRTKLDWRLHKVIPPVRFQGECGACYAFASSDMIASQNEIARRLGASPKQKSKLSKTPEPVEPLSPQHIMDCSPAGVGEGCKGGRPIAVLEHLASDMSTGGVPLEGCHKYQGKHTGKCSNTIKCCKRKRIASAKQFDIAGPHEKELMSAILNNGPALAIVHINEIWQFYNGTGIIKHHQCDPDKRGHAVIIVGVDYSGPTPCYIIKNSWSGSWGTLGYAKLEAGTNACGVAKNVVTTCVSDCETTMKDTKSILARNNYPD